MILLLAITVTGFIPLSGQGTGTPDNPYQISSLQQLQDMKEDLSAHYILVSDIDASETAGWNDGAGFIPIGDNNNPFTGSLDGQGYTITGLYINRPASNMLYNGLFGYLSEGTVSDLSIYDVDITGGGWYSGAVAGANDGGTISGVSTSGIIAGDYRMGGIVGINKGLVKNSHSSTVINGNNDLGGLVGCNDHGGIVKSSYSTGSIS